MSSASLHGLLLIDKDSGPTSHDVVFKLRKILQMKQIGHAGTLDPLASGLIVALIGDGTKISPFIADGDKGYRVTVKLGQTSDTQDRLGKISPTDSCRIPLLSDVQAALGAATGPLELAVPSYSAVKLNGRKLYEYARAGEAAPTIIRTMNFLQVSLVNYTFPTLIVELRCTKGSFVRAWASRVGVLLGTGAIVEELRRTFSDPYRIEHAVTLSELEKYIAAGADLADAFCPLALALRDWGQIQVQADAERMVLNGQIPHSLNSVIFQMALAQKLTLGLRIISENSGRLLALATPALGGVGVKIHRVFPEPCQ